MDTGIDDTKALHVLAQRPAPDWDHLAHHPDWGPLVAVAALAADLEASAPGQGYEPYDLTAALLLARAADRARERAELIVTAHARARAWTWGHIAFTQGTRDAKAVARRFARQSERHPDYDPPLPLTLDAHTDRARALLAELDHPPSPGTAALCAERLGAVMLAAALAGADAPLVHAWLDQDTLTGPAQALQSHLHTGSHANRAHTVLSDHARDSPGIRADLVALMRATLPDPAPAPPAVLKGGEIRMLAAAGVPGAATAPLKALCDSSLLAGLVHADDGRLHGRPAGQALAALAAAYHAREATALVRALEQIAELEEAELEALRQDPDTAQAWQELHRAAGRSLPTAAATAAPAYEQALTHAGLDPAAAGAMAGPLAAFVTEAASLKARQNNREMSAVLHTLDPVLESRDATRVQLLLTTLPYLEPAGSRRWAALARAIAEHAPYLDQRTNTAALTETARLEHLARPLAELVEAARLPVLATYGPGVPASSVAAADTLAAVITTVDRADAADLPAQLDELVRLEGLPVAADHPEQLTEPWQELVYGLTARERTEVPD